MQFTYFDRNELLGNHHRQGRDDPIHLCSRSSAVVTHAENKTHSDHRRETCFDCTDDVLNGLGTVDHSHGSQKSYSRRQQSNVCQEPYDEPVVWIGAMSKLLANSWPNLYLRPTLPANALCRRPTRKWPSGAETKKPYNAILNALALMCSRARALESAEASFGVRFGGTPAAFDPMTSWRKENVAALGISYRYMSMETRDGNLTLLPWCEEGSWPAGQDREPGKGGVVPLVRSGYS